MRKLVVILSALGCILAISCGIAQSQSQAGGSEPNQVPNAASSGKKPGTKQIEKAKPGSQSSASGASGAGPADSAHDNNAFPEAVSRNAAQSKQMDTSSNEPSATSPTSPSRKSAAEDNPFPEDVSKKAVQAVPEEGSTPSQGGTSGGQEPPLPSGVSSSQSSALEAPENTGGAPLEITNPARAKEDTRVGNFYLKNGNPKGAYLRFQDAVHFNPANVDAIYGLAEAAQALGKTAEARRNYFIYLQVVPDGGKAKKAQKALDSLPPPK